NLLKVVAPIWRMAEPPLKWPKSGGDGERKRRSTGEWEEDDEQIFLERH
ncbi:hypothetical protein A2U01_0028616, partial [Trifolium medium]|nr:hypothetical protein [Trifolium medium]